MQKSRWAEREEGPPSMPPLRDACRIGFCARARQIILLSRTHLTHPRLNGCVHALLLHSKLLLAALQLAASATPATLSLTLRHHGETETNTSWSNAHCHGHHVCRGGERAVSHRCLCSSPLQCNHRSLRPLSWFLCRSESESRQLTAQAIASVTILVLRVNSEKEEPLTSSDTGHNLTAKQASRKIHATSLCHAACLHFARPLPPTTSLLYFY